MIEQGKLSFKTGYWKGRAIKFMSTSHIKSALRWLENLRSPNFCDKQSKLLELYFEMRLRESK